MCFLATGVIHLALDWQEASGAAAGLAVASLALRAGRRQALTRIAAGALESGLVLGLYALWQFAGSHSGLGPDGALSRARSIWQFERDVGLPSEAWLQRLFLPHPLLVQFFNLYYDILHFPVLIACMIWLFIWHRPVYGRWRTTLVAFTGLCLVVQLIPVAPPRMLANTGMLDTAVLYHQSVYGNVAGFDADQLSAMPSVHVGWAILVAVAVATTLRSRWRWLAVAYPVMTALAVVVTANHFWLDGMVAAAILAIVLAFHTLVRRVLATRASERAVADPGPGDRPATGPTDEDQPEISAVHSGLQRGSPWEGIEVTLRGGPAYSSLPSSRCSLRPRSRQFSAFTPGPAGTTPRHCTGGLDRQKPVLARQPSRASRSPHRAPPPRRARVRQQAPQAHQAHPAGPFRAGDWCTARISTAVRSRLAGRHIRANQPPTRMVTGIRPMSS